MSKHTRTRLPEGTAQVRNASTDEVKQMIDFRMSEVFDLPLEANCLDISNALGHIVGDFSTGDEDRAAVHAINNHDKLTSKVAELELSLDDRDCYIADADMKNEEAAKRVAELEAALLAIKNHQQALTPSGFEFSGVWQIADKALKESE